ncbi:MAG: transketolase [Firmicutes bacterium]|nr:transketolase [Bacillota bacterium]
MQNKDIIKAKILAAKIRMDIIKMIGCDGQTGHLGGSSSSADILAALYGVKMRFDPQNPDWEQRDKFIYSKGHAAIAQYAAMAETGYFPVEELMTLKELGSRLQGHPDRAKLPGIEAGTGSLGQGLSIANGMALAMRLDKVDRKVYCIVGDGEINEGQIWEAVMAANRFKLNNIIAIVDHNKLQATGPCDDVFPLGQLAEKWRAFGWEAIEIDGHNMEQIFNAIDSAYTQKGPVVIIANTVKGKGFEFAEGVPAFHNGMMTPEQYNVAITVMEREISRLKSEGTVA